MPYYKTIGPYTRGVEADNKPHVIDAMAWTKLRQLRVRLGILENFPGWKTILASGSLGGSGTLISEYVKFSGLTFLIFGGPSKLYKYDAATKTLIELTIIDALSMIIDDVPNIIDNVSTLIDQFPGVHEANFNATLDDPWMSFFWNDIFYIVNKIDGLLQYVGGASVSGVVGAPRAKSGNVLRDHICLLNYNDGVDHPQGFKWCAEGAPLVWTPLDTNDAGDFDITDYADAGVALHPLGEDLIAYMSQSAHTMSFIGGNEVFARRTLSSKIGLLGPYALSITDQEHIIMGTEHFYRVKGGQGLDALFDKRVHELVYKRLHPKFKNRARGLFIRELDESLFVYPSEMSRGFCDEAIVYQHLDDVWYGPFPIQATMLGRGTRPLSLIKHIDDVPDIIDTVGTIIDQFAGGIESGPLVLFSDFATPIDDVPDIIDTVSTIIDDFPGGGDVMEIGASQDANGVLITRIAEGADHSSASGWLDRNGQPVARPLGERLNLNAVNVVMDAASGVGEANLWVSARSTVSDPVNFSGPYPFVAGPGREERVPVLLQGQIFRTRFEIPSPLNFALAYYQYEATPVGRRQP